MGVPEKVWGQELTNEIQGLFAAVIVAFFFGFAACFPVCAALAIACIVFAGF